MNCTSSVRCPATRSTSLLVLLPCCPARLFPNEIPFHLIQGDPDWPYHSEGVFSPLDGVSSARDGTYERGTPASAPHPRRQSIHRVRTSTLLSQKPSQSSISRRGRGSPFPPYVDSDVIPSLLSLLLPPFWVYFVEIAVRGLGGVMDRIRTHCSAPVPRETTADVRRTS